MVRLKPCPVCREVGVVVVPHGKRAIKLCTLCEGTGRIGAEGSCVCSKPVLSEVSGIPYCGSPKCWGIAARRAGRILPVRISEPAIEERFDAVRGVLHFVQKQAGMPIRVIDNRRHIIDSDAEDHEVNPWSGFEVFYGIGDGRGSD